MNSNIYNTAGQVVEQLSGVSTFLNLQNDGAGNLTIGGGAVTLGILVGQQYEIHRMQIVLTNFQDPDTQVLAFPKFEQFGLQMFIESFVGTSGSILQRLFNTMMYASSDGISGQYWFKEPFIFQTNDSSDVQLNFVFSNAGSVFSSKLGSMDVPPPLGHTINVNGVILLEGLRYPLKDGVIVNKVANTKILTV